MHGLDVYDNDTVYASPTASTVYTVHAIDPNSCSTTKEILVQTKLGIEHLNEIRSIRIYPNPESGNFSIENSEQDIFNIIIYNAMGQQIERLDLHPGKTLVNTKTWDQGLYFIKAGSVVYKLVHQ